MPNLFGKNKVQKPARNATHNVAGGGNKIFNILFIFVLIFISFFCLNLKTTFAATFKLIGSGNWSDGAIWDQGGVNIPTATDDVVLDNAYNVTVDTTTAVAKTLDMTGSAGILTITNAMKLSVSGSVTLASGKFTAGGTTANLTMLSTGTLTTAGNTMGAMTFSGASQIFTLGDSLLATGTFVLSAGTFNAGTYNITANNFSITAGTLNMGSGLWKTTNITTISTWVNNSGTVVNCNTSTLELSGNSTSITRSLGAFSGSIFYNLNISGTTTAPAQWNLSNNITVNGTFTIAGPNRIKVGIGKIITLGPSANLVANGTAGSLIEWNVISGTTPWTLSKASGNVNVSYLNLIYSTASGGANFYASHSTDGGNNSGWVFANAPDAPTGLTGIHGDAQASLSWTAGADNGAPITDYVVEYKLSSNPTWSIFSDGVSVLTSATVTGLTNGLSYDFRVSAVNGVGQGTASATTTIFIGPVKYARGVGGNWSADATWSTTSGGVANTVAPTATDYVIFDANSGNVTVDTTTAVAKNLNMTGSAGTLTITNAMKLSVSGSVTLASGKFTAGGDTAELAMLGTGTLITTGNTMGGLTFNGSGQTFTLGDAVTTRSGSQLTYYSGTLITGAFTHNWGRFRTETTVAKTFDITNSTINILYDTWNITSATNFTLISTNSTIGFYL